MSVFQLLLPIALAGAANHVLSTLFWMVLPHHKPEWKKLPDEDAFLEFAASRRIPPDQYLFPLTRDSAEMRSEAFLAKQRKCSGMLILWKTPVNMLQAIVLTLTFFVLSAFVIGYLATLALKPGAAFMDVFQFVFTAGLLTHCAGKFPFVFWFRRRVMMELIDGVAYAAATAVILAVMWPTV